MFDSHVNNQQQEQNNSTFTASTSSQQPSEVKLLTTQTKTLFIETLTDKQKQIDSDSYNLLVVTTIEKGISVHSFRESDFVTVSE